MVRDYTDLQIYLIVSHFSLFKFEFSLLCRSLEFDLLLWIKCWNLFLLKIDFEAEPANNLVRSIFNPYLASLYEKRAGLKFCPNLD